MSRYYKLYSFGEFPKVYGFSQEEAKKDFDIPEPNFKFPHMYSKRRSYRRRPYRPYRRVFRGRRVTSNPGVIALRRVQNLERAVEPKQKVTTIDMDSGGTVAQCLNLMAQGDDRATRSGNYTMLKSVSLRATISASAAEADGYMCRIAIVYDKRPAAAACTWASIFTPDTIDGLIVNEGASRGRFSIIADRTFIFDGTRVHNQLSGFWRLNKIADYSLGNAGTIADMNKGALWVLCKFAKNGAQIDVDGSARLIFTDQ